MKKQSRVRWGSVVVMALVTFAASVSYAEEQPWSRAWRGELYPIFQMLGGDAVTGFGGEIKVEMDDTPTFGAGMGFNLDDHLNINTEMLFGSMNMTGSLVLAPDAKTHLTLGVWLWNLNFDYNILTSRLTPLVTAGFGLFRLHEGDANISETHWTGNVGAGGRWDITDSIALRLIYRFTWVELEDADDPYEFDGVTANLIFMFK